MPRIIVTAAVAAASLPHLVRLATREEVIAAEFERIGPRAIVLLQTAPRARTTPPVPHHVRREMRRRARHGI